MWLYLFWKWSMAPWQPFIVAHILAPSFEKAHLIKSQSNLKTLRTSRHLWDKVQSLPSHPRPQSTFHPHYPSPSSKPLSQQPLKITRIFLANYTVFNSSESFFLCVSLKCLVYHYSLAWIALFYPLLIPPWFYFTIKSSSGITFCTKYSQNMAAPSPTLSHPPW